MTAAVGASFLAVFAATAVCAIEIQPSQEEIHAALGRGADAAKEHRPPDTFYTRFGATDELHPSGFLITKLAALSVMATHMGLRGVEPAESRYCPGSRGQDHVGQRHHFRECSELCRR